jgi:hypothetical protein
MAKTRPRTRRGSYTLALSRCRSGRTGECAGARRTGHGPLSPLGPPVCMRIRSQSSDSPSSRLTDACIRCQEKATQGRLRKVVHAGTHGTGTCTFSILFALGHRPTTTHMLSNRTRPVRGVWGRRWGVGACSGSDGAFGSVRKRASQMGRGAAEHAASELLGRNEIQKAARGVIVARTGAHPRVLASHQNNASPDNHASAGGMGCRQLFSGGRRRPALWGPGPEHASICNNSVGVRSRRRTSEHIKHGHVPGVAERLRPSRCLGLGSVTAGYGRPRLGPVFVAFDACQTGQGGSLAVRVLVLVGAEQHAHAPRQSNTATLLRLWAAISHQHVLWSGRLGVAPCVSNTRVDTAKRVVAPYHPSVTFMEHG